MLVEAGEANVPVTIVCPMDGHGLDVTFDRSGQPELKSSHIADSQILTIQFPSSLFKGKREKGPWISYLTAL